ncbi:oligosaccharide repeat unit polymerase [Bacillus firmus]|nr:oligosaccharide repeat unit polymerase [Cytobacillus firmus]
MSILILSSVIRLSLEQTLWFNYSFLFYFIIFLIFSKKVNHFGLGAMVLYYIAAISFGYPIAFLIEPNITSDRLIRSKNLYGVYFDKYIALSILALSSYILGQFVRIRSDRSLTKQVFNLQGNSGLELDNSTNYYYQFGCTLIWLYSIYMGVSWITGNIPTEYLSYKEWSGNQVQNYLKIFYWFGTIFVMSSATKKQIIKISFIFLIPTIILLATGNRNDVLYPVLIGIGIYVHRFKKVPIKLLISTLIFLLFVSPIIASTRSTGINLETDYSIAELMANGIMELGGQIPSVSNMFSWIENGESFAFGGTYFFATIALFFGSINPQLRELYFLSRYSIESRLPTLAFTMSAELYYNFASVGVILFYFMISSYVRRKDKLTLSTNDLVRYSFNMFLLLHLVRNQFYFSAIYIVLFYLLYFLEKQIRHFLTRSKN